MNFQQKIIEKTEDLRSLASAIASQATDSARTTTTQFAKRAQDLKASLALLKVAGSQLNQVARRHASRFVKENSAIALEVGKDMGTLARRTFAQLSGHSATPARKPRKTSAARKRSTRKAA